MEIFHVVHPRCSCPDLLLTKFSKYLDELSPFTEFGILYSDACERNSLRNARIRIMISGTVWVPDVDDLSNFS